MGEKAAVNTSRPAWLANPSLAPSEDMMARARARQAQLTKPPGALGMLEDLAIRLAGLQRRVCPRVDDILLCLFAGDHGIAQEGVSAFPQAVTRQMLRNFSQGGAAICVLARMLAARFEVHDLGTVGQEEDIAGVCHHALGPGTENFLYRPAMTHAQCAKALEVGYDSVRRAHVLGVDLFIGGEMGIGNTTAAAALGCALLNTNAAMLAGPGTGLAVEGVSKKIQLIDRAIALHRLHLSDPYECLRYLGGFEIAALSGSYIACAQLMIPAVVDGFIATAAALVAERLCPHTRHFLFFGHRGAEPGHGRLLQALEGVPLLALGMRLGEGSGAAVAAGLMKTACALHNEMATFAEAHVSDKQH